MKKSELEKSLGKNVELVLKLNTGFYTTEVYFEGKLCKTGTEEVKSNPNLYYCKNWYFVTMRDERSWLFRSSHVKSCRVIEESK